MTVVPATRVSMVWPPLGLVNRGVAPLRAEPDDEAELVDEAHAGEQMTRLTDHGEWAFVQGPDLYFGWIRSAYLNEYRTPHLVVVAVPLARVHATASPDAEVVDQLPAGVRVMTLEREGDWLQIGHERYLRDRDTVEVMSLPQRYPAPADLVATAESFLDVPYRWGGTSAQGLDCSGLTQQVYFLNGVGLDRDADQQALGGRPVDVARPGDLFFFGKDRVTHTALATGERTFIHAPQSGQRVQRGELTESSALRATRRYLP
ncbi:MAG TPA: NlpC/P60 family protein [Candidatus Limnocylindria bacterium]